MRPHDEFNERLVREGRLKRSEEYGSHSVTNSTLQYFFYRQCGKHVAYRSRSAVDKRPGTLECPQCNRESRFYYRKRGMAKAFGKDEWRLLDMLDREFQDLVWSAQDHVAWKQGPQGVGRNVWPGAVDVCVYFPVHRYLAIQVDGLTHAERCMPGRPALVQGETDGTFVEMGTRAGWNVLRLNHKHSDNSWRVALQDALKASQDPQQEPQGFYSNG